MWAVAFVPFFKRGVFKCFSLLNKVGDFDKVSWNFWGPPMMGPLFPYASHTRGGIRLGVWEATSPGSPIIEVS